MSLIEMPKAADYTGRMLMLNAEKIRRFQCGGFSVNTTRPVAIVEQSAQMDSLRAAVMDGRLIDVTDQNIKGLTTSSGSHTPIQDEDTNKIVFIGYDKKGNKYIVTPKDEEDKERLLNELRSTGTLKLDYKKLSESISAEISPIITEDLPQPKIIISTED